MTYHLKLGRNDPPLAEMTQGQNDRLKQPRAETICFLWDKGPEVMNTVYKLWKFKWNKIFSVAKWIAGWNTVQAIWDQSCMGLR